MTQPPDDAALVAKLLAYRPTNEWGDGVHHVICTEAATALEAKDRRIADLEVARDEALRWLNVDYASGSGYVNRIWNARAALEPSDKGVGSGV